MRHEQMFYKILFYYIFFLASCAFFFVNILPAGTM